MYKWNDFIERYRENNKVDFLFIFEVKRGQIEDALLSVESSGLKNRVYLDTAFLFKKENPFVPIDEKFHTMLIDKNGIILLIGNPRTNKKIEQLFTNIINIKR